MKTLNLKNAEFIGYYVIKTDMTRYGDDVKRFINEMQPIRFGVIETAECFIYSYFDKENGNPYSSARLEIMFANGLKLFILFRMEYSSVDNMKYTIERCYDCLRNAKPIRIEYSVKKTSEKICKSNGSNFAVSYELQERNEKLFSKQMVIVFGTKIYNQIVICNYCELLVKLEDFYKLLRMCQGFNVDFPLADLNEKVISVLKKALNSYMGVITTINGKNLEIRFSNL